MPSAANTHCTLGYAQPSREPTQWTRCTYDLLPFPPDQFNIMVFNLGRHGGTYRHLRTLLRYKLVHHDQNKYDGYRLTYMGYDFLAIRTLLARGHISAVGRRIGVGKESDVFEVRRN